jgi:hypothetical protein
MPIVIWKNGAILIYKAAKYIAPLILTAGGAVVGFFVGRRRKKGKGGKGERA